MIVYNGVSLESVANVMVEDIRVNPIQYSPVTRARAIQYGSEFVRMRGGERKITITFAILEENPVARREMLNAVSQWARTDAEYKMELPQDPTRYLMCVCTAKPEPSARQWWESKLRLVFTCFNNPFWTDKEEKSVACGTAFTVLGDAPPLMRIERTVSGSAAQNQTYSKGAGQTITFSSIPVGDMVIDLNNQTAAVNGSSIMEYYQATSIFIIPATGTQNITGVGTVKYRERWE
jgi:predicted phage tail component-like protein